MNSPTINLLLAELDKQFANRQFYSIPELKTIGLFKNEDAVRKALRNGKLAFISVSKRRRMVPRVALVEYLKNNITENR